jgi:hypothetical protein
MGISLIFSNEINDLEPILQVNLPQKSFYIKHLERVMNVML